MQVNTLSNLDRKVTRRQALLKTSSLTLMAPTVLVACGGASSDDASIAPLNDQSNDNATPTASEASKITISGSAFRMEFKPPTAWGMVNKVYFQYGSIADAEVINKDGIKIYTEYRSHLGTKGTDGVWRSPPVNTLRYQASLTEAGSKEKRDKTLSDVMWSINRLTVLSSGETKGSRIRVRSTNSPVRGIEPTWKNKHAFEPSYESVQAYVSSYTDLHESGNRGSAYGKELEATSIVNDPVHNGKDGHKHHGKVVLGDVPNDYVAKTAGRKLKYNTTAYDAEYGDQPGSGGLRWQYVMPPKFGEGDMAYHGRAILIDPDFPTPTSSHVSIGQIFGEPFEWGLLLMLTAHTKSTEHGDTNPNTWQIWGERLNPFEQGKLFEMPFYRGQWVDVVIGVGFSRDVRKGWIEIHTRRPGKNQKLIKHTFPDGTTRLSAVTLPEGYEKSGGLRFHDHIYRSPTAFPVRPGEQNKVRAMFTKQKLGPTAKSVDPESY
jgi:hypothetical protein